MHRRFSTTLIAALFLITLSSGVFSQVKFGFRGGLNLANASEDLESESEPIDFNGEPIEFSLDQTNRTTFGAGGLVEFWFSPAFALQLNVLYNQKGVKLEGDLNETIDEQGISFDLKLNSETTVEFSYLSFPLLAKLRLGQTNVKPYIMAGPELGYLLSAKIKSKATAEATAGGQSVGPITTEMEEDIDEFIESFEFAINFGAGLTIPLGSVDVFVDGQYSLGLTNVDKEESDAKNQVIMINAGILFGGQ